mgnify:CR=1 FL=1
MRLFEDICYMTQAKVKKYMKDYLTSEQYNVIDEDGFLYAKGTVPVLLVAHMDTVHKQKCHEIVKKDGKISSPTGIGGDDRCGVFIIQNIVSNLHCSVLLCEDEEKGGIGVRKFVKTDYAKNLEVNYIIEFDRRGSNDAVFYSCDNKEFAAFVLNNTGFKLAFGSFSDISVLAPASKICAVNLSCGYYNPHTVTEYVVYDEMMNTIKVAEKLIQAECTEPFVYKAKIYDYTAQSKNAYTRPSYDYYDYPPHSQTTIYSAQTNGKQPKNKTLKEVVESDLFLELEAIVFDVNGDERVVHGRGSTKYECWFDLFINNGDICFDDIIDYSFA